MSKDYETLYEDTFQQLRELTQEHETLKEDMRTYKNTVKRRYKTHSSENSSFKAQITKLKNKCEELKSTQTADGEELSSLRKEHSKLTKRYEEVIYNVKRARDIFGRLVPKECN